MRGDILDQSDFVEHHDLRNECDWLQPEGVAPCEFPGAPPAVDDQSGNEGCWEEYFKVGEVIAHGIVSLYVGIGWLGHIIDIVKSIIPSRGKPLTEQ